MATSRIDKYILKIRENDKIYQRNKRKTKKEDIDKYNKKYINKYPQRILAYSKVSQALKRGLLKKKKCNICKRKDTQAHHNDYSKALEVIWLCPIHHKKKHLELGRTSKKERELIRINMNKIKNERP